MALTGSWTNTCDAASVEAPDDKSNVPVLIASQYLQSRHGSLAARGIVFLHMRSPSDIGAVYRGSVQQDYGKKGRSNLSLAGASLLTGRLKLSNGRGQAGSVFVAQKSHHTIRALPADFRNQKAAQPVLLCTATIESFVGQSLRRLSGSEPTSDEGGGAHLPFIVERTRLAIDCQDVELVGVDRRGDEERAGDKPSEYDATPIGAKGSEA
jgi:hypothetical protein